MNEQPVPPPDRPGVGRIALTLLVTTMFAVKAARWWVAIEAGTRTVESMTTWEWVKVGFYHLAAVGGLVVVIGMVRARLRPAATALDAGPDRPPAGG